MNLAIQEMPKIADLVNGKIADFVIEYRIHASKRMFRRNIQEDDVETVLKPDAAKWTSDFSGRIK